MKPHASKKKSSSSSEYDQPRPHFLNSTAGWVAVWMFRVVQAVFLVQGADVPDEWWQSTEVAEYVVFGKGELTWEWGREALRSYVYPLPFIVVFYILKITSLDSFPVLVWLVPRLLAATTCFGVDFLIAKLAKRHLFPSERAYTLSIVLSLSSWFLGFVGVRTQSNVAEALAFLFAVSSKTFVGFLLCCGFGCAFRVTFAIPAMVVFYHRIQDRCLTLDLYSELEAAKKLRRELKEKSINMEDCDDDDADDDGENDADPGNKQWSFVDELDNRLCPYRRPCRTTTDSSKFVSLFQHLLVTAVMGLLTLVAIALIDSFFYGRVTCSPLNFLVFNVVSGLSKLFGTHPIHWYLTSALPVMFLTLTPLAIGGFKAILSAAPPVAYAHRAGAGALALRSRKFVVRLAQVIAFSTCVMSMLGHKEMRFLYFTVPCMVLIAAAAWSTDPFLWKKRKIVAAGVVFVNLAVLIFFGLFWQRGPLSVASYLRSSAGCDARFSVHALTHCFAMPGESFFHGCAKSFVQNTCPVEQMANLAANDWRRSKMDIISERGTHERFSVVLPNANDMFLESPLVFVEYVYEGRQPASDLFRIRVDAAFNDNNSTNKKKRPLPMRFVLYDVHDEILKPFLERNGYAKTKSFFHTWIPLEDYHGRSMLLYEKKF